MTVAWLGIAAPSSPGVRHMFSYALRDLLRNPRRTLASVTGVALAVGLFASITFLVDASAEIGRAHV